MGACCRSVSSYTPVAGSLDQAAGSKEEATETAINEFLRITPLQISLPYYSQVHGQKKSEADSSSRSELKLVQDPKVEDVFFSREERLHRAFKTLISSVEPFGIKEIVTDAQDSEVLQVRDFVYDYVDGKGQVFNPNPVNTLNDPSLRDSSMVSSHNPNPYYTVSLMDLEASRSGVFELRGPYVVLRHIELPFNTPPKEPDPNGFIYERGAKGFEDVMAYYHIDRMQRYIQLLGFTHILNKQLAVDAHGNLGADGSHYVGSKLSIPGQPYIAFGLGGVDDAEDADVIAHEYGHAIQDDQAKGKYGIVNKHSRAMGEGFSDYWAVSSFRSETDPSKRRCVMEWDRVGNTCRRVDTELTATDFQFTNSNHRNGQIWSATLFDILKKFDNKADADKLILESHFNVPDNPSFEHAAGSILTADRRLYGGSHITQLCQVFRSRRIYPESDCESRPAATGNVNSLSVFRIPVTYFLL